MHRRFQIGAILCLSASGCIGGPEGDQWSDNDTISTVEAAVSSGWKTEIPFYWPYCGPYVTFARGSDGAPMKAAVCSANDARSGVYWAFVTVMNQSKSPVTAEVQKLKVALGGTSLSSVDFGCSPRQVNGYQTVWCVGGYVNSMSKPFRSIDVTAQVTIRGKSSIQKTLAYSRSLGAP